MDDVGPCTKHVKRNIGKLARSDQSIENILVACKMQWPGVERCPLYGLISRIEKIFHPTVEQTKVMLGHANNRRVQCEQQASANRKIPASCARFGALAWKTGWFLRRHQDGFVQTLEELTAVSRNNDVRIQPHNLTVAFRKQRLERLRL